MAVSHASQQARILGCASDQIAHAASVLFCALAAAGRASAAAGAASIRRRVTVVWVSVFIVLSSLGWEQSRGMHRGDELPHIPRKASARVMNKVWKESEDSQFFRSLSETW